MLTGNVRDLQIQLVGTEPTSIAVPLESALSQELVEAGLAHVVAYDPVRGFRVLDRPDGVVTDAGVVLSSLGLTPVDGRAASGIDVLGGVLDQLVQREGPPVALLIDFASRLVVRADALSPAEQHLFAHALVASHAAMPRPVGPERTPLFNTIIWIAEKEGDLPDWLSLRNPRVRHIPLAPPDRAARQAVAPQLIKSLPGTTAVAETDRAAAVAGLVDETEGLLLMDLKSICQLARTEGVSVSEIGEAVRRYKLGVTEDAWRKVERAKVNDGEALVGRRVIGQSHAVTHMLDIVKRAVTGVSGARRGGRPRGVAFLAGPTGVGKTELAKAVTELLFGDESAYIRFDMSEFSAEHADQRLLGAPPGYVGYDVGGELTNAIRERPFSVVLFDEIEKAHPRILDKFLQVLDDGVLTSGRGERVYFSEALIVFTSNLGVYGVDAAGDRAPIVSADQPFGEVQTRVRAEIERYFKLTLGRPEILNRIGDNVIVFDFIRPEIAEQIFGQMLDAVLRDTLEAGYAVSVSAGARASLEALCTEDLSNGGRGIRNKIETHFINPLSRALFEHPAGGPFEVRGVTAGAVTSLEVAPA